jgi:hypothetical protein
MSIWNIIISILTGLATAIPLVIKLVKYMKESIKEKNWQKLLILVQTFITEAEANPDLTDGAARKAWVINRIQALSGVVDYNIDIDKIDELIDSLVAFSKKVNVNA